MVQRVHDWAWEGSCWWFCKEGLSFTGCPKKSNLLRFGTSFKNKSFWKIRPFFYWWAVQSSPYTFDFNALLVLASPTYMGTIVWDTLWINADWEWHRASSHLLTTTHGQWQISWGAMGNNVNGIILMPLCCLFYSQIFFCVPALRGERI